MLFNLSSGAARSYRRPANCYALRRGEGYCVMRSSVEIGVAIEYYFCQHGVGTSPRHDKQVGARLIGPALCISIRPHVSDRTGE